MTPTPIQHELIPPSQQSIDALIAAQETDATRGLSHAEAQSRLGRDGLNELIAKEPTPAWLRFLAQFQNLLVILLLVATAISAGLWSVERESALPYEALAILAVVLVNACMGYVQESRAESAVKALQQMMVTHAHVIREGEPHSIAATEIVVGDLILIEEGDTVPADARLTLSTSLQMAEASLTGESLPVLKDVAVLDGQVGIGDRFNMIWSGTAAASGRGKAIVTATGMRTEMGRIAEMLEATPDKTTPLQKELEHVGKLLAVIVVIIAIVMIATIVVVERVREVSAIFEVFILGVALAVAAVPEGLPAMVTTVLSLGVGRMAKRHAIVRHLAAVETLGSATIIASDKTGTLTKNEMTVRALVTASGYVSVSGAGYEPKGEFRNESDEVPNGELHDELQRIFTVAERASNAVLQEKNGSWVIHGDPTEGALIAAARKAKISLANLEARFERVGEIPFSSERKLMSAIDTDFESQGRLLVSTKGAPGILLERCTQEMLGASRKPLTDERRAEILRQNELLAGQALRTLGIAERELPKDTPKSKYTDEAVECDFIFLGLIGMIDPPREEAKQAVALARSAGIRPLMITGDHPKTASAIAHELGITNDERAVTGDELEQMSDLTLAQTVREVSVYARVNPKHKLRIIKALRSGGEVVAMTGDGINDAPALKVADIGLAMGITGTDVAKEAADVVLTDDNFATIVAAVEEGRAIFDNIRKFLRYLLSSNIGEVLTMFFGVVLAKTIGLKVESDTVVLPLLATHILWINLVTDSAPALALGVDPANTGIMQRPPRSRGERVITRRMWTGIFLVGVIMATGTLLMLDWSLPGGLIEGSGSLRYAQTMAFTTLVMFQLFNVFNARSDEQSAFHGLFHNRWLWGSLGLSLSLQVAVIYVPFLQSAFSTVALNGNDWLCCVAVASSVLWLREGSKIVTRIWMKQTAANRSRRADKVRRTPAPTG